MSPAQQIRRMIEDAIDSLLRGGIPGHTITGQINGSSVAPASGDTPGAVVLYDSAPEPIGSASAGGSTEAARGDHVHAHGSQAGGSQHSAASSSVAGFMPASDKAKLDTYPAASGLTTGYVLTATGSSSIAFMAPGTTMTRWEPLTNGDPDDPALIFAAGDVIMIEVPL